MNGLKAALITCSVTLLLAVLTFFLSFGGLRQEVANLREDVGLLVTINQRQQEAYTGLCERVAGLEARIASLVGGTHDP